MEMLIGLVICLGLMLTVIFLPVMLLFALAGEDYRSLRRVFRERRFGLLSVFLLTAIVAVALGVVRASGTDFNDPGIVCLGVIALGVGIVVVGLVWLMFSDRLEQGESKRMRDKLRTPDIQIVVPSVTDEILIAELADEDPPEE